ncbi:MAG: tetratricopeptide repeat protein, partial [Planctomycetota bacterium]|nr:tetratricopeptide repeat protein [Planctomycetota bacterium]
MRVLLTALLLLSAAPADASYLQDDAEIEALVAAERAEADLLRRRGKLRGARALLRDLLEEQPKDPATRVLLARVHLDDANYEDALDEAQAALTSARELGDPAVLSACGRTLAMIQLELGRYAEALATLEGGGASEGDDAPIRPGEDARDAWMLGRVLADAGDAEGAREAFDLALTTARDAGWEQLWAKASCERALGRLTEASRTLVLADRAAKSADGAEPDVLASLASLYFESEKEVEAEGTRSAGNLFREALEIDPTHKAALLGLFELHRYNRQRTSRAPEDILNDLLSVRPNSVDGLLAQVSADLSDGQLKAVRATLARLEVLAPGRREGASLQAALAWIEHRREDCEAILAGLVANAEHDSRPERDVGRHLTELYRFAESLEFLRRATERDPSDYQAWTWYARSLANVGREDDAREALRLAKQAAAGRQDVWRNNMDLVLRRMSEEQVTEAFGELTFAWTPDAAEVLRTYLVPFYGEAREELARRYGHTPGPTTIEIFRSHEDFSVRSVGFAGFPALGVCFGQVVTALSPLSELRGSFSWARTGFHEFSHVVHLGLSHNRCPRWITEGLATWEEVNRNPSWTRNMRRELIDARAQDDLIAVRELNRAFRGPRILFGYYQGGLLCQMLIEEHGFPPMIHLLEAFDAGKDLDTALRDVFDRTPEELDASFEAWVDLHLAGLSMEPRWGRRRIARLRLSLPKQPPSLETPRERWTEDWVTVAWGSWQQGKRLDAEEALRLADLAETPSARALFLRGEMALDGRRPRKGKEYLEAAVELGGRDFRGLIALGALHQADADLERAEEIFLLAEQSFPGYDHPDFSAELRLVGIYEAFAQEDDAMAARERWLRWNPGDYEMRVLVALWHREAGRHGRAAQLLHEANEVDPFRRDLHRAWGESLVALERWEEAEREFRVTLAVPPTLDPDHLVYVGP